jgi:hypothetical protein
VTWKKNVLVVANVTAASPELIDALQARAAREPMTFTFIVPATPFHGGREAAEAKLAGAVQAMRAAGLEAEGSVGPADPIVAVQDVWDPKRFDEIVVSTLPIKVSKWLHAGLPERIAKLTDAPVSHVVSQPEKPEVVLSPPPAHPDTAMGPLSVLGWGGPKDA